MITVTKLVLTADTKAVPVETPCQKDVWWNGHIPPHILKTRTDGPASCSSHCIVRHLLLCHLKFHDHVHISPPPQPILRQTIPVHTLTPSFKDVF